MSASPIRRQREKEGRRAEWLASWFLRLKGYRILDTRVRTPWGEIDIIAARGRLLLAVEVKARTRQDLALVAIDDAARARLGRAAVAAGARYPQARWPERRIDVIAIVPGRLPLHLENALSAPGFKQGGRSWR